MTTGPVMQGQTVVSVTDYDYCETVLKINFCGPGSLSESFTEDSIKRGTKISKHLKGQATRHDFLHRLLGDGDK
jgi:hypothetical protein